MSHDSFGSRSPLEIAGQRYEYFRIDAVPTAAEGHLPVSLRILLENLLRREDGVTVTREDILALAGWRPGAEPEREIAFAPARVLMQDFTGVPAIVDLAALRDAVADLGGDPARLDPRIPAELVIDHSISADVYGVHDAFRQNAALEFERNRERYRFLRWGQQAFGRLAVVPPNTGICHQVNLEHLARVVFVEDGGLLYPDTLVGTDSHTTMINGLGVLGWGVGGIEAEAALLGQPIPLLIPRVVGFRLTGELRPGTTATDLVLTITERLRAHGVVGSFVEFHGPGLATVPLADRATIANMAPEYGATCSLFPIDRVTLRYLELTGRSDRQLEIVEAYARAQGLWHEAGLDEPRYSDPLTLDLGEVEPSIAGPTRPQDRVPIAHAKRLFAASLRRMLPDVAGGPAIPRPPGVPGERLPYNVGPGSAEHASAASFPASDPPAAGSGQAARNEPDAAPGPPGARDVPEARVSQPIAVQRDGEPAFELDHGHVVIAAITSCTNTSNPSVMLAAGLLAKKAAARGLRAKPWVKTSLAPGSKVVMEYYERAGLVPYLERLGFDLVGYGCTTCIGNSGPLLPEISRAIADGGLAVCAVLSGNRNFEGRINPDCRMNYLASPPLVVAYALAGTLDIDFEHEPLGIDPHGAPVFLRDVWPSSDEVAAVATDAIRGEMFRRAYRDVFTGDERWRGLDVPGRPRYEWDGSSTYVRRPPFLDGLPLRAAALADVHDARVLLWLGDSVTTDHISPAGVIRGDSPAGRWLVANGVAPAEFNSYGSRRGNHEVMLRGTFANPRLRNRLAAGAEGGVTRHLPGGELLSVFDAAERYRGDGVPLIVLAGKEYGSGSSRDWAAKGTALLGVRAVIAESYERIHRSNLVGMGVLPLQFERGTSAASLGLTGEEPFTIAGFAGAERPPRTVTVRAGERSFEARVRIDTPTEAEYFRHGGILPYVARKMST